MTMKSNREHGRIVTGSIGCHIFSDKIPRVAFESNGDRDDAVVHAIGDKKGYYPFTRPTEAFGYKMFSRYVKLVM
jgi:hypothetical protein